MAAPDAASDLVARVAAIAERAREAGPAYDPYDFLDEPAAEHVHQLDLLASGPPVCECLVLP